MWDDVDFFYKAIASKSHPNIKLKLGERLVNSELMHP